MQVAQAMNNARNNAAKKKDTLTLSYNKRSTDAPKQAEEKKTPEAADPVLTAAVQALHDKETDKTPEKKSEASEKPKAEDSFNLGEFPLIVPRVDLLQNQVVFLANSQNPKTGEIQFINLKEGIVKTAPVDYYRSTKPVEGDSAIKSMVKQFVTLTGSENFRLRSRLIKNHVLERDTEGKVDEKSVDQLKANLLKAAEQFIQAIKAA